MGKTPPFDTLMVMEKWFATSRVMHSSLGVYDTLLANEQVRISLQYLKSCTGVWVDNNPPLLIGRKTVV